MESSQNQPQVAVVGCFQNGKSTLVNCLLDGRMARTGTGLRTTPLNTVYSFGEYNQLFFEFPGGLMSEVASGLDGEAPIDLFFQNRFDLSAVKAARVRAWKPILDSVDLIDTPGFNADEQDDSAACAGLDQANFAILIINNRALSSPEKRIIEEIGRRGLHFAVLMNCTAKDKWHPESKLNVRLSEEVAKQMVNIGVKPECLIGSETVWRCNLLWFWMASGHYENDPDRTPDERSADKELAAMEFKRKGVNGVNPVTLAEQSNFIPIRRFLKTFPWRGISGFESRLTGAISNASNVWQKGLEGILARGGGTWLRSLLV